MNELKNLIKIINPNIANRYKIFEVNDTVNGKVVSLYKGIAKQHFEDHKAAREELCPGNNSSVNYFYLKSKLESILINTLFQLPTNFEGEKLKSVWVECYRKLAAVMQLINTGNKAAGFHLAQQTLKKCLKFHVTDVALILAQELAIFFASSDPAKGRYFHHESTQLLKIQSAEARARLILTDIYSRVAEKRYLEEEQRTAIFMQLEDLEKNLSYPSYKLIVINANAKILLSHLKEDFNAVVLFAKNAIEALNQLPFLAGNIAYFSIYLKMIPAYIYTKEYVLAQESIDRCIELSVEGAYNWHISLIYQAIAGFRSRNYGLAETAFLQAQQPNIKLPQNLTEQWRIIEAYLYFLDKMGKVRHERRFKLGKFLNEVPIFSKDKRGANLSIIIVQLLILLVKGRKEEITDRVDSLNTYTHKYLRKDDTFRSNCFIKMLLQLPLSRFNQIAFQRKSESYYLKLISSPVHLNNIEIELIPYEDLYDLILELL